MNITLSAPESVIQDVRQWAAAHKSSLNQIVREALEAKAKEIREEREKEAAKMNDLLASLDFNLPKNWEFNREEHNLREDK